MEKILAQRPAATFGKNGLLGVQFHARLVITGLFAIFANPQITGGNAFHRTIIVVEYFSGRKTGVDFNAQRLCLLAQPTADFTQADNVIPLVVHLRRSR